MADVLFQSFRPLLLVASPKAKDAIAFYKEAFGAKELSRTMFSDSDLISFAELEIAGMIIHVSDNPLADATINPQASHLGGATCNLALETEDVAVAVAKAVKAGAKQLSPISNVDDEKCCTGNSNSTIMDPFNFMWMIACPGKKLNSNSHNHSECGSIIAQTLAS